MTNDIERHSPEVWRKAADSLRGEADASDAVAKVNRNGAPLLGDTRDLFRPKTGDIPAQPGVYKWRDGEGRVIYVGKAKSLRNRLTNYFQPLYLLHPRTQTMVLTARSLEWTVVGTELEALTLEYTWIKEFDPRFNVQFRDDKTYPYLAISSGEAVPRVWVTRSRKRRDARYFGPYAKVWELRQSLDKLLRTFPVRTCTTNVFHKAELTGRPCLLASIGKCSAPCIGRIAPKEHRRMCEQLVGVMTGRLGKSYIAQLTRDMKDASAELEFEKAARLRDEIQMLQTVMQQNAVVFDQDVDADVFGMASDELEASVHAFIVRDGSIRGERNWSVERVEDVSDGELIDDLIMQVYSDVAADNGLNVDPHDGTAPSMASPSGNEGVSTAEGGASIVERRDAIGSTQTVTAKSSVERAQATRTRRERQEQTGRIECYDISNTVGGAFQVASMVVFEDAIAKKSEYRRFAIRGDDGKGALDDLSALYETLTRRFRHGNIAGDSGDSMDNERRAESSDTSASTTTASSPDGIRDAGVVQQNTNRHHFAYMPNLVVVDGGHPQVMAAAKALADCGVNDVAVCGLAKRLEEVWVPDDEYPIILKRQSEGMYLLQRVRDESHRFAITYHRQTRRKGALRSALDGIPGVGETYQKRLLSHFGSVRAMRDASVEELEAVKGIGHAKAEAIHAALHAE